MQHGGNTYKNKRDVGCEDKEANERSVSKCGGRGGGRRGKERRRRRENGTGKNERGRGKGIKEEKKGKEQKRVGYKTGRDRRRG